MNKKGFSLILFGEMIALSILLFSSCSAKNSSEPVKPKTEEAQDDKSSPKHMLAEGNSERQNNKNENYGDVQKSGVTTHVPWVNDESFKKAQQQNGTFEMMAAFRTVLEDPLPGEEYNVHLGARYLAGAVIKPGEVFSQNKRIGPYTEARGFQAGPTYSGADLITTVGGGVCKIASTLYNAAVLSDLQTVERHNHTMPVPYVPYGQDATVSYGTNDLRFKNTTSSPVLIWAQGVDNVLYIGFYGNEKPAKVGWHHETINSQKAPVVYRDNPSMAPDTEKKVAEGMDGATVKSWVVIEKPDGTKVEKQLGKSYYKPFPHIIERRK